MPLEPSGVGAVFHGELPPHDPFAAFIHRGGASLGPRDPADPLDALRPLRFIESREHSSILSDTTRSPLPLHCAAAGPNHSEPGLHSLLRFTRERRRWSSSADSGERLDKGGAEYT